MFPLDIIIEEHWSERRRPIPNRPGFVTHANGGKVWTITNFFGSHRRASEIICDLMGRHDPFQRSRPIHLSEVPKTIDMYGALRESLS